MKKIILDLCGGTGSWGKPYKAAGYSVLNLTLPEYDVTKCNFYEGQIIFPPTTESVRCYTKKIKVSSVYGVLAAPPCTKFTKASWNIKKADRDFEDGMKTVRACLDLIWYIQEHGAPLKFWALENPMGYLYNFLGKPAFYFQPWQFGEKDFRATKRTALWGYFNQPATTVRKRNVPFIRDPKKHKGGNIIWGKMNAEERARTSSFFAAAFYQANK